MQDAEMILSKIIVLVYGFVSSIATIFFVVIIPLVIFVIVVVLVVAYFVAIRKRKAGGNGKYGEEEGQPLGKIESAESPIRYVNVKCKHCGSISMIKEETPFLCPDCGSAEGEKLS